MGRSVGRYWTGSCIQVREDPAYQWLVFARIVCQPVIYLVVCQLVYTIVTLYDRDEGQGDEKVQLVVRFNVPS